MSCPRFLPSVLHRGRFYLLAFTLLLGLPACRVTDLPLWRPAEPPPGDSFEIERVRDIPYCEGPDAGDRHRLDLYLPRGLKDYPVVMFVHGGAWSAGDNRCCGLYSSVGEFLASRGIGAVLPNYRLSPSVKHPEHIRDVARAFAWTRNHIAGRGGDPTHLFVAGHSAGAHLVALLATDERYLRAEGLALADIKGVLAVSGVYHLPAGSPEITLGGFAARALRLDQFVPFRGESSETKWSLLPGIPMQLNVFGPIFGDDPRIRAEASPLSHVRPGLPPFLICCADDDLPTLAEQAEEFHRALLGCGCESRLLRVAHRNHHSIIFRAIREEDPVGGALLAFVRCPHAHQVVDPRVTGARQPR